jgi:hypothetical protein
VEFTRGALITSIWKTNRKGRGRKNGENGKRKQGGANGSDERMERKTRTPLAQGRRPRVNCTYSLPRPTCLTDRRLGVRCLRPGKRTRSVRTEPPATVGGDVKTQGYLPRAPAFRCLQVCIFHRTRRWRHTRYDDPPVGMANIDSACRSDS